jgi:spore germination protein KC
MRARKLIASILIIFTSSTLPGCYDKTELEEGGYAVAIGLDKGEGKNIKTTFQIPNPKVAGGGRGGGGESSGEPKSEIITISTPGIITARDLASASSTRRISLAHAKVVIVGEEFARDDRFFQYLEASLREQDMRRSMTIIVSRENAEDFIRNNNPILESKIQKYYEFMSRRWRDTGIVPPYANINKFMQRTEGNAGLFLAIYASAKQYVKKKGADEGDYLPGQIDKTGGNTVEMIGAAVFKNGKMIGRLTGNETRLVSFLRKEPETKSMLVTFTDPLDDQYRLAMRIFREKKTKINIDLQQDKPNIQVTVPLKMDILAIPSFIDYAVDMDKQEYLKTYLENYLEKISMQLVEKTQKEYKEEPFLWELDARRKFFTYDEYDKYDWSKHYEEADIDIKYDIKLRNFGKMRNPLKRPRKNEEAE